jgi:hypothetical protein
MAMAELPPFYTDNWDDKVGLWARQDDGYGATGTVHLIRDNAWMLVSAGFDGLLHDVQAGRVLRGIQSAQAKDGPKRGCFWWKLEDGQIRDTNSGFFTGMALITLRCEFGGQLAPDDLAVLDTILRDSRPWFRSQTESLTEKELRYPNRCLGDLVCRWLLMELYEPRNELETEQALANGLAYYQDSPWGWGEHLSDLYGKVCQGQLTALLAYAKRMPAGSATVCETLLRDTMATDALYAGGPRVPTIRCYALDETPPKHMPGVFKPWRELMSPWTAEHRSKSQMIMADVAFRHGLHERIPVPTRTNPFVEVPCYKGTLAMAQVTDAWRLGVMSRYPIMKGVDNPAWGLHWQSMPVAFFRPQGDWGFLQWVAEEKGTLRALPAMYRDKLPSHVLSDAHPAAAVGRTFGCRYGNGFLVLRRMDAMAPTWPFLADRFRLLAATCGQPEASVEGGWKRLDLPYGDDVLTLAFHALEGDVKTTLSQEAQGVWHWEQRYAWPDAPPTRVAGIWMLTMGRTPVVLPVVERCEGGWRIQADGFARQLAPFADDPWGEHDGGQAR